MVENQISETESQWLWYLNSGLQWDDVIAVNQKRNYRPLGLEMRGTELPPHPHFYLQPVLSWNHEGAWWGKKKKTLKGHDSYSWNNRGILITTAPGLVQLSDKMRESSAFLSLPWVFADVSSRRGVSLQTPLQTAAEWSSSSQNSPPEAYGSPGRSR